LGDIVKEGQMAASTSTGTTTSAPAAGAEMKRTLSLTGITVNAMALIAPGAFLWTTFQLQAAQAPPSDPSTSTAGAMWAGLLFALVLAMVTAYSYAELARAYPDAGTGSSYYFAEAALLEKEKPQHRKWARTAKVSIGWISHLYYWMYPGIMIAFTGTLFGYIYTSLTNGNVLGWGPLALVCVAFAGLAGYIAFRGISGSTMTAIVINVIQIVSLLGVSILFVVYRLGHTDQVFEAVSAKNVLIPENFLNVLFQSTIAILLLVGFESVTALGAEAKRPEKDVKRAVLLSLLIQGGICYLIQYFAANFAVGGVETFTDPATGQVLTGYAAAAKDPAPIGSMLTSIGDTMFSGGKAVSLIVAVTVLIALIGTTLACLNTGVRVTYAMARDKEVPGILGLLHGRFATPHAGVWVLTGVSALFGIYGVNPDSVHNVTRITLASNTGTFLVYGCSCLIAITAFAHRHDKHWFKHYVIPAVGTLMNVSMLAAIIYLAFASGGDTAQDAEIALGIVALWIAIGAVWVAVNPGMRGRKLVDTTVPRASLGTTA
jgi:APA family basic amino acid/polyamine antiporter